MLQGLGAAHDVREGEPLVLPDSPELEQLGVEEEQRVEQHDRGVRAQLLTLPQVLLLHSGVQVPWRGETGDTHTQSANLLQSHFEPASPFKKKRRNPKTQ